MAAHALTILRHFHLRLNSDASDKAVFQFVHQSLSAAGADTSEGFDWDVWCALEDMSYKAEAPRSDLKVLVEDAIQKHLWMDAYPCLESIRLARNAFVKQGNPHWRKRDERFMSGSVPNARRLIIPMYPLARRAPTF